MYKVAGELFEKSAIAQVGAAALLLFEPRMQWISLSGMETTLCVALFLASFYAYLRKQGMLLGVTIGLMLWTRPDAVVAIGAFALTLFYERFVLKPAGGKKKTVSPRVSDLSWLKKPLVTVLVLGGCYCAFNAVLSGSVLPNTYAAKVKYYAGAGRGYPAEAFEFFSGGHMVGPIILVAVSLAGLVWGIGKRKRVLLLFPAAWSVGLFLAYWIELPRLYQHGRYIMPMLPALLLLAVDGARILVTLLAQWIHTLRRPRTAQGLVIVLLGGLVMQFVMTTYGAEQSYAEDCRYIMDRQVKTGLWIRDHLPQDAVVATHDIGAIAYYSGRRVVDMVGLVSPEMIKNIGRLDLLMQFLVQSKVTHVAVLRNWFEIVNVRPLFVTDPAHPEIMEVFPFDRAHLHFTTQEATRLNDAGEFYLSKGDASTALQVFKRSYAIDPRSARTTFLIGNALLRLGDSVGARVMIRNTVALQPDYPGLQLP